MISGKQVSAGQDGLHGADLSGHLSDSGDPSRDLFARIKPGLIARARQPAARRKNHEVIFGMLLGDWGGEADAAEPERLLTDVEMREVLIYTDDELRGHFL